MSGLSSKEINYLYKKGKRFFSDYFNIFFLSSEELKIAVVVSKKISKKAVIRNKIKRRIRHLSRENLKEGKFVIVVKKNIADLEFKKIENDFKKIVSKIN